MKKIVALLIALLFLLLAGCQAAETATPTDESQPETPTAVVVPTRAPAAELSTSPDYCLECHTDQEKLVSLAKPEESHEAESKGVG